MALPWLKILDTVVGLTQVARQVNARARGDEGERRGLSGGRGELQSSSGALEARLSGVVISALKEVFDRDSERFRIERERLEMDRARAERLLRIELARQTTEREVARLRLIAIVAAAAWLITFLVTGFGPAGASTAPVRLTMATGWLLLLGALGTAVAGQAHLSRRLDVHGVDGDPSAAATASSTNLPSSSAAFWLLLAGLAVSSVTVLLR